MKGIVLAGGTGSRLWPITSVFNKQLLPIYDKPMIYYPISTLMELGITEIQIITTRNDQELFRKLLGEGESFGIRLSFEIQDEPKGIAESLIIAEDFINEDSVALILGDNLFYSSEINHKDLAANFSQGAHIFTFEVQDPNAYGVLIVDDDNKPKDAIEKPKSYVSAHAITGLYIFDSNASQIAKTVKPSFRGELEIIDVIKYYINANQLKFTELSNDSVWFDTGNPDGLLDASTFIKLYEHRTGKKIACLEELALKKKLITKSEILEKLKFTNHYTDYLRNL